MGGKKSKALANNIIDDLLNDDSTSKSEVALESSSHNIERRSAGKKPTEGDSISEEVSKTIKTPPLGIAAPDSEVELDHENTVKLAKTLPVNVNENEANITSATEVRPKGKEQVRASVGRLAAFRSSGGNSATEASLAQSESLRIAQQRIFELEKEIERLRLQNEEVAAAAETLRRIGDELTTENESLKNSLANIQQEADQEKSILIESKESVMREIEVLRKKNEDLEVRVSTNIQKIRVRERELENRLELVKMEGSALIRSKDEMLLDLKRQVDQLNLELNNYRSKNQELNRQMNEKLGTLRRTVKTLRLALSMLEGEEPSGEGQKKAK